VGRCASQDPSIIAEVLFMVNFNQTMKELAPINVNEFIFPSNIYGYIFVGACLLILFFGILVFRAYRHWIDRRLENHGNKRNRPSDERD